MDLSQLYVVGISYSNKVKPFYVLVLGVAGEEKRIPIVIGYKEASSIVDVLTHARLARPNTHDLMSNIMEICGLKLRHVIIYKLQNDIFYSRLVITNDKDKVMLVETRTSDAVALAMRQNAAIVATREVLDAAPNVTDTDLKNMMSGDRSMVLNSDKPAILDEKFIEYSTDKPDKVQEDGLSGLSDDRLLEMMNEAIGSENYELASRIKQEIERRSSGSGKNFDF